MARSERNRPDVYFGRPGALVKLPWPRGDISAPFNRLTYDFLTGAGQHHVSSLTSGSREYTVTWKALHVDNYALLEQYWTGMMGPGPWVFIDPSRTNLLMTNQAAATNLFADARQWIASGGTLQTNTSTTYLHRFGTRRSLRWLFSTTAPTTPTLSFEKQYRSWYGVPVVPGLSYAFSSWMRADGVIDTSITAAMQVRWLDSSGALLSTLDGGATAVSGWTQKSAVGVAPANAAYADPQYVLTGSSIITGGSLYIDEPLFEQDTVVNAWAPGTGLRPVEIISFPDEVPFAARFRVDLAMVLRELAI